jgi:hypothetical protein
MSRDSRTSTGRLKPPLLESTGISSGFREFV